MKRFATGAESFLRVSADRRRLETVDGDPFFYLADTAWELFHKLDREEAVEYLRNRASKRFTAIQAVALAEHDGLRTPNAYGRVPLVSRSASDGAVIFDPAEPDLRRSEALGTYSYWDHVDFIVAEARKAGLYVALLPTWGDKFNVRWGKGPEVFTPANARAYGRWIGNRYRDVPNIIWVLGGDRDLESADHFAVIRSMAAGIAEGDGGRHLRTFHPTGTRSSSELLHAEEWLDFNMIQTGHGLEELTARKVTQDYCKAPTKPVVDGEPRYEDHPRNFNANLGYWRDAETRRCLYRAVLAGACGHTYGHHCIWSMTTEPSDYFPLHWREAMDRPGAYQLRHALELFGSRDFASLVPCPQLLETPLEVTNRNHLCAAVGTNYAYVYVPTGRPMALRLQILSGWKAAEATWFDPRTGEQIVHGPIQCDEQTVFTPPTAEMPPGVTDGNEPDWILILDRRSEAAA